MKTLRNKCAVAILTLTLAVSASAGQIQCPGVVSGGEPATTSNTGPVSTSDTIITSTILAVTSLIS